jgi:hypothetical protein
MGFGVTDQNRIKIEERARSNILYTVLLLPVLVRSPVLKKVRRKFAQKVQTGTKISLKKYI